MPWSDYPLRTLVIPQDAGPFDPRTVIGPDIPAELAAYYLANHAAVFSGCTLEYFGGNPNPYHYRAVTNSATFGQLQIAEGYVVWNGATPNVAPTTHYFRPGNTLGALQQVIHHDPDDTGSSTIWSPNSAGALDIQTNLNVAPHNFPFVKALSAQPLNVTTTDYLGQGVADLTLTTADQFVAGDMSFITYGHNTGFNRIFILGVFDFDVTVAGAARCVGDLYIDGANVVNPIATFSMAAVGRATVAQLWTYVPADHNSHTFQLQARKTAAVGTAVCRQGSTRMIGLCVDPIQPPP